MLKKFLRWPTWLILGALVLAALVPTLPVFHAAPPRAAHATNISRGRDPFLPYVVHPPKAVAHHTTVGVNRVHLPALPLFAGKPQHADNGKSYAQGALISSNVNPDFTKTLYFDDMESGAPGWTTAGDQNGHNFWSLVRDPGLLSVPHSVNPLLVSYPDSAGNLPAAHSGLYDWGYGDNPGNDPQPSTASMTYMGNQDTWPQESSGDGGTSNGPNSASLISPSIDLTSVHNATLSFATWWEIEGLNPAHFDMMYVEVSTNGGNSWTTLGVLNPTTNPLPDIYIPWSNSGGPYAYPYTSNGIDTPASWQTASVNLTPYAGHHVQLRFRFDSVDQTSNGFRGWFIDDVGVYTSTGGVPQLSAVSPNIGKSGDTVTISGSGFGSKQGNSTVTFNGVNALVQSWGNNGIVTTVPEGVTSGPLVVTVHGVQTAAVTFTINAGLYMDPGYIAPGGFPGTITGQGFAPNESVAIYLDGINGSLWTTITADNTGALPAKQQYAPNMPYGMHFALAIGQTSHIVGGSGLFIFPSLSSSADILVPGQTITMTGHGYAAYDSVQIQVDFYDPNHTTIGTLSCNSTGDCSGTATIPADPGVQGTTYLSGYGTVSASEVGTQVTFTPGLVLVPSKLGKGSALNVYGGAFNANETVQVYLGSSSGTLEGTAITYADGSFDFYFNIPLNEKVGTHTITVVRNGQSPPSVAAQFEVLPPTMISPGGIHNGQPIKIKVSGFTSNSYVSITWNANGGEYLGSINLDNAGSGSGTFVPSFVQAGSYTLTATGPNGLTATSNLNVGPGIWLSPDPVTPGGLITVYGGGYPAGETVHVYFKNTPHKYVSATVNTDGTFTATLIAPIHYDPTVNYYIYAVSTDKKDHASAPFSYIPVLISGGPAYYGTTDQIGGVGFAANEQVDVYWGYQQQFQQKIATVTAASNGSFTANFIVPGEPNIGTINIAAIGETSDLTGTSSVVETANLLFQPTHAPDGGTVSVNGGAFGANETVTLTMLGTILATPTTDSTGAFTTTFIVPGNTPSGLEWVQATGSSSGVTISLEFQVDGTVVLTPNSGPSGIPITVTGNNFASDEQLEIDWYDPSTGHGTTLDYVTTQQGGSFTANITAPSNLQSGNTYYVEANNYLGPNGSAPFLAQ